MQAWKEIIKILAGKLTAGLAFAVIMLIVVAKFGGQLPPRYQSLPYWLIGVGYGVYAVLEIARARSRRPTPQTRSEGRSLHVGENANTSLLVTGDNNQITYIIQGYARYRPAADRDALHRQIADYLNWIAENFGKITLRGIEQGGRQVVELPLDTVTCLYRRNTTPKHAPFRRKKRPNAKSP